MAVVRLTLLVRHDCELCDELHSALARDPRVAQAGLELVDITSRSDLFALHAYRIPVLFDAERELYAGRFDDAAVTAVLDEVFSTA